ncbi:alanine racemase [Nocardioides sp. Kera G14]|uniref:alanine racemase n=1 Tax=Nocardioides sp. Kera G14 TaxID=2884264 RepID=UPI001D12D9E1|nr:alanine racemase [Nocardioides sp. Kera G14]UDY24310.1 alanine racemase [Nocardioides sp. Kera G14]
MTSAEIVVDLGAIRHNVRTLLAHTETSVMAVVKADGYGHGMVEVARAAREAGASWLGVATLPEAVALRDAGDEGRLLCWLSTPSDSFDEVLARDVDVSAYDIPTLERIQAAAERTGTTPRLHLKVDTGLSRGGAMPADWHALFTRVKAGHDAGMWRFTGIFSHFATSEEPDNPSNDAQEKVFREALDLLAEVGLQPEVRHLANSAAAVTRPSARFDLVRCGIATYGLDPAPGVDHGLDLRPALSLQAELAMVKELEAGAAVSYGGRWVAPHATVVGLVPAGYAEGIPRASAGSAEVLVAGARRPMRGSVCMDQFVVELGVECRDLKPGEPVLLLGPGTQGEPTAQDWADASGTIHYEIVTRLGGRLTRRYVDSNTDSGTGTGEN